MPFVKKEAVADNPPTPTTDNKPPIKSSIKYYAIIVMDEGCTITPADDLSFEKETFLEPAQTPEQWYQENNFDFVEGNTIRGIVSITEQEAVMVITHKNSYIPPVDNGDVGE